MSPTNLESRVRDVLARQAVTLQPPDVGPDDTLVVVSAPRGDRRPRGRLLVGAAAVGLLVVAGIALANRSPDDTGTASEPTSAAFHFETPQVLFDAASVEVDAGGRTFVPTTDVSVNSDFGLPREYTTLELEWDAQGVPMRIYIYFASDGTDWWATEVRTYDGSPGGEWIETHGEYFRSALGAAYQGDFDVSSLHIHGLRLEAFRQPAECSNVDTSKPLAVVANYGAIDVDYFPGGGFGWTATLTDTTTCEPVATANVSVSITSDDPEIATIQTDVEIPDKPIGTIRVDVNLPKPGTTTIHLSVRDKATDALIDQLDIPVTVH